MTIHKRGRRAFYVRHWAVIIGVIVLAIVLYATDYFGLKG
jgi:hypothetical protein